MADCVEEESGFWLPSEFLTDDDFLIDKQNLKKNNNNNPDFLSFPNEFPYHTSEKCWVMSTSPQSTLSRFPSPPTTPLCAKNDAVEDLIHRTAGEIAKLKLSQGFVGPPTGLSSPASQNTQFQQQNKGCGVWYSEKQMLYPNKRLGEMGQGPWVIQPNPTRFVGSGTRPVKRECAGTGVFLPRRYGNNNRDCSGYASDSRKKSGFSTALLQNRAAVDAIAKSFDNMTGLTPAQPVPQPRLNQGFIQDYDKLMARRHALMLQQRRSFLLAERLAMMNRDMYLPQEWTY